MNEGFLSVERSAMLCCWRKPLQSAGPSKMMMIAALIPSEGAIGTCHVVGRKHIWEETILENLLLQKACIF
jgi:hypothetical protein